MYLKLHKRGKTAPSYLHAAGGGGGVNVYLTIRGNLERALMHLCAPKLRNLGLRNLGSFYRHSTSDPDHFWEFLEN